MDKEHVREPRQHLFELQIPDPWWTGNSVLSFEHKDGKHESYSWHKRGGYADKKLRAVRDSLRKMRWKQTDSKGFAVPDGSFIGSTQYYAKGGWVVSVSESYGGVKWDNSFDVRLSKAKEEA